MINMFNHVSMHLRQLIKLVIHSLLCRHTHPLQSAVRTAVFSAILFSGALNCLGGNVLSEPVQLQIAPNNVADQWKLFWNSEPSCLYFVEYSEDLSTWTFVRYHLADSAAPVEELFANPASRTFYRLQYTEFSSANPSPLLTGDADGDSISNYDEISSFATLGLDALDPDSNDNGTNDGAEDADGDSDLNAYEFTNGRLVFTPDADVNLYTDVALGDDSNYSGISAVPGRPTATDGPKASIASAIGSAVDGNIILLQTGSYNETNLVLNGTGKNLTLRPNGPVTIR